MSLKKKPRLTDKFNGYILFVSLTIDFLEHPWLHNLGVERLDRNLILLLFKVYFCAKRGDPLHKKAAWKSLGMQDIKTWRKYLSQALKLGLIEVMSSAVDRRKQLLYPSKRVVQVIEREMDEVRSDLELFQILLEESDHREGRRSRPAEDTSLLDSKKMDGGPRKGTEGSFTRKLHKIEPSLFESRATPKREKNKQLS